MAKSKNKKFNSDKIRAKTKKVKAVNPFELKVVKSKFDTLKKPDIYYCRDNLTVVFFFVTTTW